MRKFRWTTDKNKWFRIIVKIMENRRLVYASSIPFSFTWIVNEMGKWIGERKSSTVEWPFSLVVTEIGSFIFNTIKRLHLSSFFVHLQLRPYFIIVFCVTNIVTIFFFKYMYILCCLQYYSFLILYLVCSADFFSTTFWQLPTFLSLLVGRAHVSASKRASLSLFSIYLFY